ncbi:hypothetical protein JXJ21_16030 [candidate division KSB1 bacterium]|nr:hypothetical protein [candidate division KSB1 bacterium]
MDRMTIPNEAVKYILFQRTAYLRLANTLPCKLINKVLPFSIYNQIVELESRLFSSQIALMYEADMRSEYLSIKKILPETCSSILDIGCGVAGLDVFLSNHYSSYRPTLYLLDKTHVEKSVWYGIKNKGAFYNSLDISKQVLIQNYIPESHIHILEATDNNDINIDCKISLIVSLISWGFHYPVETYLEKVHNLLTEGGVLILDIRKDTEGIDVISRVFGNVEIIFDRKRYQRVVVWKRNSNLALRGMHNRTNNNVAVSSSYF